MKLLKGLRAEFSKRKRITENVNDPRVDEIIEMLEEMDVDGETMEYIITSVGMEEQMLKQLTVKFPELVGESTDGDVQINPDKKYLRQQFRKTDFPGGKDHPMNIMKIIKIKNGKYVYNAGGRTNYFYKGDIETDLKNGTIERV